MKQLVAGLLLGLFFLSSCVDPTIVGSELLEGDQATIDFTDTLTIRATTLKGDSVRTYSPFLSLQLGGYICGDLTDPVFGRSMASVYAQPRLERTNLSFSDIVLDSLVLVLPYDSTGFYGDTSQLFGIEVFELLEDIPNTEEYFSNQSFANGDVPIGSLEFIPSLKGTSVIDYTGPVPDTFMLQALRIPLNPRTMGVELFPFDSLLYLSDTTFLDFFKGLHIRPSIQSNSLISFNLFTSTAGIYLYYTQDGQQGQYRFVMNQLSTRFVHFEHDYEGAVVENFIEDDNLADSLLFVQGMAGLNTKIEIPYADRLKNIIVNKAELVFNIATLDEDDPLRYPAVSQLLLLKQNVDGELENIQDVIISNNRGVGLEILFGGVIEQGQDGQPGMYKMNISAQFQDFVDGVENSPLIITVFPKAERPSRVVLFGANHSSYAIKLNLTFTKL